MEYEFTTAPLPPDGRARNGPRNPLWVAVAEFGRAHPSEWFKAHVGGRGSMSAYGAQIKKGRLVAFRGGIWQTATRAADDGQRALWVRYVGDTNE